MLLAEYRYKCWADERTLLAASYIDEEAYPQQYAFICQQLNHMVMVEELFKARLLDSPLPHESTNSTLVPDLDEIAQRLSLSNQWYQMFVAEVAQDLAKSVLPITFADGQAGRMSVGEILFHIVNHGSYHRGSIAHALDLAGVAHPSDGYALFAHQLEPARRVQESAYG